MKYYFSFFFCLIIAHALISQEDGRLYPFNIISDVEYSNGLNYRKGLIDKKGNIILNYNLGSNQKRQQVKNDKGLLTVWLGIHKELLNHVRLINKEGEDISPSTFHISDFENGYASFDRKGYGLLGKDGEFIVPPIYVEITNLSTKSNSFQGDYILAKYREESGNITEYILGKDYEVIYKKEEEEDFYLLTTSSNLITGKYLPGNKDFGAFNIINDANEVLASLDFPSFETVDNDILTYYDNLNRRYYYYNYITNQELPVYSKPFNKNGLQPIFKNQKQIWIRDDDGKFRLINRKGEYVSRNKYDDYKLLNLGDDKEWLAFVSNDDKCGILDARGKMIYVYDDCSLQYTFLENTSKDSKIVGYINRNNKYLEFFDIRGDVISVPINNNTIKYVRGSEIEGYAAYSDSLGQLGIMNYEGEFILVAGDYFRIDKLGKRSFLVCKEKNDCGILNLEGKWITDKGYDYVGYHGENNSRELFEVMKDKQFGLIDETGTFIQALGEEAYRVDYDMLIKRRGKYNRYEFSFYMILIIIPWLSIQK